ncbi:hypothetical protein HMPREF9554_00539 [Treponema phagedenis F0421]|nr:hypothetical protein HMPREF9554_00539 [Treponema phagedenis F0421]
MKKKRKKSKKKKKGKSNLTRRWTSILRKREMSIKIWRMYQ